MRIPKGIEFNQYIITTILCRYMFLSSNEKVVRGKKGSSGVHIYKTSQVTMTKRGFLGKETLLSCILYLIQRHCVKVPNPQAVIIACYSLPIVAEQVERIKHIYLIFE